MKLRRRAARGLVSSGIIAVGACAMLLWQGASAGIFAPGLLLGVGAVALGALSLDVTGASEGGTGEAGDAGSDPGDAGGDSGGDGGGE